MIHFGVEDERNVQIVWLDHAYVEQAASRENSCCRLLVSISLLMFATLWLGVLVGAVLDEYGKGHIGSVVEARHVISSIKHTTQHVDAITFYSLSFLTTTKQHTYVCDEPSGLLLPLPLLLIMLAYREL